MTRFVPSIEPIAFPTPNNDMCYAKDAGQQKEDNEIFNFTKKNILRYKLKHNLLKDKV